MRVVPKRAGTRNADVISEIETVITWSELTSRGTENLYLVAGVML